MFDPSVKYTEDSYELLDDSSKEEFWRSLKRSLSSWCPSHEECPLFSNDQEYSDGGVIDKLEFWSRYDTYYKPQVEDKRATEVRMSTLRTNQPNWSLSNRQRQNRQPAFEITENVNGGAGAAGEGAAGGNKPTGNTCGGSCNATAKEYEKLKNFAVSLENNQNLQGTTPLEQCQNCCSDVERQWNAECKKLHQAIADTLKTKGCPAILIPYSPAPAPQVTTTMVPALPMPQTGDRNFIFTSAAR